MDLTGITFDATTLQAGALIVLGFTALVASIGAVIGLFRRGGK